MLKILQLPLKQAPIKFLEQLNFNFQNHCNGKQHVNSGKSHLKQEFLKAEHRLVNETWENPVHNKDCGLLLDLERATETKVPLKSRQGQKDSNTIPPEKLALPCAHQKDPVSPTQWQSNLKRMFWETGHYLGCDKSPWPPKYRWATQRLCRHSQSLDLCSHNFTCGEGVSLKMSVFQSHKSF